MREPFTVGILREGAKEKRAPLTPSDAAWLVRKGIDVEVESSPLRVFRDSEYRRKGAKVLKKTDKAELLVGIKAPRLKDIRSSKAYMIFSHTIKGQKKNMPLLKRFLDRNVTLIDYEKITDERRVRLVYFGRFAGICGVTDSLYFLGKKLKKEGIDNPFLGMKPSWRYRSLEDLRKDMGRIARRIKSEGFDAGIAPFIVGITGQGNVSRGAREALGMLGSVPIQPGQLSRDAPYPRQGQKAIYEAVFPDEELVRSKDGKRRSFEEYLEDPRRFESNLDSYLPRLNMLIHGIYWDDRYPRLVTREMVKKLCKEQDCRLELIGDISCDIGGSIELTYKTTTRGKSVYTYDPEKDKYIEGPEPGGITVLAIDNLPSELPGDSSKEFGGLIREYVFRVAENGAVNLTRHAAIPAEIRRAVITQNGRLTTKYKYLRKHLKKAR